MKESATKNRILDVASRLFYEQGYNTTGINQIIDEADIARASFYNHFPSKHDLLAEYLDTQEEQWFESLHVFIDRFKDPKQKVLALFDSRIESQFKTGFNGCAFVRVSAEVEKTDAAIFKQLSHQKDKLRSLIRDLVAAIKPSETRLLTDEQLGDTLFLLLEGAATTGTIKKEPEPVRTAKKIAEKLLQ
jgi:AcrR family transcriptional regulator